MSESNLEVATQQPTNKAPVIVGKSGIVISDIDSLWRFSTAVQKSGLAPKGIQSAEAIFVAIQMGLEVGLTPMAALQNIAVINGRPSIWGDAQLAVVRGTGEMEGFEEWFEVGGNRIARNPATYTDDTCAVCRVKRRGFEATEISFSVADAKLANLWGKDGPWRQYPWRMLRMRARSFALRDQFGDALRGMRSVEENQDTPAFEVTPQVEVRVAPAVEVRRISDSTQKPDNTPQQTGGETEVRTDGGNGAAEPQATKQAPPAPPSNSRVAIFRKFLSDSGISEKAAMDQIHKMFRETDSLAGLDDVEAIAPHVINGILRTKAGWVAEIRAGTKDGSLPL
jgi:hypothetical protein